MSWVCMCPREHREITPACPDCLHERPKTTTHEPTSMYRLFGERVRPQSSPSDVCECGKTVREHIDEFKRIAQ